MTTKLDRPLPVPTPVTRPFWDGLADGRVRVQKCEDCGTWVFYPRGRCSRCLSERLRWQEISGEGTLYTFTITHQPTSPHFADDVPQLIAVVELDEGVRLTTNLVNVKAADIRVGMRVKPSFDRVGEDVTLLNFQPA